MSRAERLPVNQESAAEQTDSFVIPKKEKERSKERASGYDLLVHELSRLDATKNDTERQEVFDDVAMNLSAQRDQLSDHERGLLRVDIGNLWAGRTGERRARDEKGMIKELLTRLGDRGEAADTKDADPKRPWAETDAQIAAEQKTVVNEMIQHIRTDVRADKDLTLDDQQTLESFAGRMEETVAAFDEGRLDPVDFTTDVTLLLADLGEARNRIEGLVSARNTLKRLHAAERTSKEVVKMSRAAFKKIKTQQNKAATEITAVADGLATDSGRDTLPEIARVDYKGPPDDLPVEEATGERDTIPDLVPNKIVAEETTTDERPQLPVEAVSYESRAQEQIDTFLKLDAEERRVLLTEFKGFAAGGEIPNELSDWTKEEFQKLVRELERTQKTADRVQQGETERNDRYGIAKKLTELMRTQPAGAESPMRIHTGIGWETLTPQTFADRYVQLREKNDALTGARLTRTFGQKVSGLFGRLIGKNPDNAIMNSFEQNEFKQMNDLLIEHEIVEK